jgi:hypothetical protein
MSEATTQQSASIAKLLPALIRARGEFPALVKDSQNPHFRSMYADLAAVLDACDKPLGKHDLAILQVPVWDGGALVLQTTLAHTSGEWIRATYPVAADLTRPQVTGAGMTYARRYCYMAVAGIAPEDDDGETATARGHASGHATQPAPARPVNAVAARNLASHENRGGPVARNQPREAPPRWGGDGAATNGTSGNGNGNGNAAAVTPAIPPPPTRGSQLWKWAAAIERQHGPGMLTHLEQYGASRGWGTRLTAWSDAAVREGYENAMEAMEVIYDVHGDGGDADPDDSHHDQEDRDY